MSLLLGRFKVHHVNRKTTILISMKWYRLEKSFGKGYGYEAAKAWLHHGFIKMKIQTIYASQILKILVPKI
jgi:RimJ/RimL family protein N-acetyltransferase